MRQVEILAPAGTSESLYGALKYGADAVYTGVSRFGARAFAKNLTVEELISALTYAHLRGKKIYLTVNTLLNDRELEEELFPLIRPLYEAGLDACIVQDFGVLSFLHDHFPDMDLHASTQMTLLGGDEANLLRPYGVTRYIPARELTIEEIRQARKQTDMEIEVFVHGALCYCYSGQCLMSEVIGERSGNRGMCAGPCRLPYRTSAGDGYVLNTKDICTLTKIPELVDAGIDSFKIEGRMKKKEYSAENAYLYRKYVTIYQEEGRHFFDELVKNKDSMLWKDYKKSCDLYNRGGFSDSFLFEKEKSNLVYKKKNGHFGTLVGEVVKAGAGWARFLVKEPISYQDVLEFRDAEDISAYEYTVKNAADVGEFVTTNVKFGSHIYPGQKIYRRKNDALLKQISEEIERVSDSYPLQGKFTGKIGEPVCFTITGNGTSATVTGDVMQNAQKRPVTEEEIRKNLDSLGNTSYYFEKLEIDVSPYGFLPIGGIKKLRRLTIAAWEKAASGWREVPGQKTAAGRKEVAPVVQENTKHLAIREKMERDNWIEIASAEQLKTAVSLVGAEVLFLLKPEVYFDPDALALLGEKRFAIEFPRGLHGQGRSAFEKKWEKMVSIFEKKRPEAVLINSYRSLLYAEKYFPESVWYADENLYRENKQAEQVLWQFGMVSAKKRTYGRRAVMVTSGCVAATTGRCPTRERIFLQGPKGDEFIAVTHCDYCYNTIYTKEPVRRPEQSGTVRLDFTWETPQEVREVMREWNLY
jgi:putative protease